MGVHDSVVDRVMGRISIRPERPKGGRFDAPRGARLQRAGARHGPAVFKTVRNAGATSREGLKGQLNYIFQPDKVYSIIDSRGRLERHDTPDNADLNRLTREWSNDWWKNTPKLGHTSHMIFSFPKGVSHEKVEAITRDVLGEMLEGRGRDNAPSYKYVAAIHHDRDHPHAHVIVNRRGSDGQLLTMRRGAEMSYEGFRESMARHAERYGVRLDPTFRYERGIAAKQPSLIEQILARKDQRAAHQRPLTMRDRMAIEEPVKLTQIAYSALAVVAQNADADRLAAHYQRVSELLHKTSSDVTSERILPMDDLNDAEIEVFDRYLDLATEKVAEAEKIIAEKPAAERVAAEIELADIMADLTRLNPEHPYARDLHTEPSVNSIYSARHGDRPEALRDPDTLRALDTVSRAYGLDTNAIVARIEAGPRTQYTEQAWAVDDMRRMLESGLVEASTKQDVIERISNAYDDMRDVLERARVIEEPQRDARELASPDDIEERIAQRIAEEVRELKAQGYSPAAISERELEITDRVREEVINAAKNPELAPLTKEENRAADMLYDLAGDNLYSKGKLAEDYQTREALMMQLAKALPASDYERLRSGDPSAVDRLTDSPVTARAAAVEAITHDRATGREIAPEVQERQDTLVAQIREATGLAERDREEERQRDLDNDRSR